MLLNHKHLSALNWPQISRPTLYVHEGNEFDLAAVELLGQYGRQDVEVVTLPPSDARATPCLSAASEGPQSEIVGLGAIKAYLQLANGFHPDSLTSDGRS